MLKLYKRKRGKIQQEKCKSEPDSADPPDDGHTYGINCINLGETKNNSESEYKWILAQRREGHMENK